MFTSSTTRSTSHSTWATTSASHGWRAERIGLRCSFLDINFFSVDNLFWGLEQVENDVLIVVGNKAEVLALVLHTIEGHFDLDNISECAEEGSDCLFGSILGETADEDLAGAGLGLFRVHALAIDDMLTGVHDLHDMVKTVSLEPVP